MDWRPIPSLDGTYEASSCGLIRRVKAGQGTATGLMKLRVAFGGYLSVSVCLKGKKTTLLVHRLVHEAFLGPIPEGHDVCHRNHNRQDNRAVNLYAGTRSENILQSVADGRPVGQGMKGRRPANAKLTPGQRLEVIARYAAGAYQTDIAAEYGIAQCRVSQIIRGLR